MVSDLSVGYASTWCAGLEIQPPWVEPCHWIMGSWLWNRSPVVLQLRMFGWLQKPWQSMASSWQMLPQNCWDPWEPRSHAVAEVAKALELSNFVKQKSTKMTTWQCFTRHLWSAPKKSFLDSRLDPQTISIQNTFVWIIHNMSFFQLIT